MINREIPEELYSRNHHKWETVGLNTYPTIDEHTLFKYSVIPWEAVMDYAFTKKTGRHTQKPTRIPQVIEGIENNFANEFANAIKTSQILEPFNQATFLLRENETHATYTSLLAAHVTKTPIK